MPITHHDEYEHLIKKWRKDEKFHAAYDELATEFDLFDQMLEARKAAGLTQEDVANRMGTQVPAIARLESSGGKHRHSPTLETLRKYAHAVGCELVIQLVRSHAELKRKSPIKRNRKDTSAMDNSQLSSEIDNNFGVIVDSTSETIIKSAIATLPIVGTFINEILFDFRGRLKQNRFNSLVNELNVKLKNINREKVDFAYLRSEEFHDLTLEIFEQATKIREREKHAALAELYVASIIKQSDLDQEINFVFISFIRELTSLQIILIKLIHENEINLKEIGTYEDFYNFFKKIYKNIEIDKSEFKFHVNDLEKKSLISCGAGLEDFESTRATMVLEQHKNASVKVTHFGRRFLKFL